MLSSLVVVGAAGVLGGLFLRIPAVLFATAIAVVFAVTVSFTDHYSLAEMLVSVILHAGVLQAAYLSTLLATSLWSRARAGNR